MRSGGFDRMFDFPLYYALTDVLCGGQDPGRVASVLWADRAYADPSRLVTFADNHDLPRIASKCADTGQAAEVLEMLFAVRGTPSITWGTEYGQQGTEEPQIRADMDFGAPMTLGKAIERGRRWRQQYPVLADGRTVITGLTEDELTFARLGEEGAVRVKLTRTGERYQVSVTPLDQPVAEPVGTRTVRVSVSGAPPGEVRVVGAGPELGRWDPGASPGLAVEVPVGGVLEYKLVVVTGDDVTWEERGNRFLFVRPGEGAVAVDARWGQ